MRHLFVNTSARRANRSRRRLRPDLTGWLVPLEDRALLSTITVTTFADEFDVPANVTDATIGSGGGDNTISLREAITAASQTTAGVTEIDLPVGTYSLSMGEILTGKLANQNITIKGLGTPANTTISQTLSNFRIFNLDAFLKGNVAISISNVTLSGATNVSHTFGGGAIVGGGPGDSLTLTNDVVTGNSTLSTGINGNGGALSWSGGGDLTVIGTTFSNNTAGGTTHGAVGGAIAFNNSSNGNLTITGSTFTNNSVTGTGGTDYDGGALFISGNGTTTITATTFTGNSAGHDASLPGTHRGGAIFASGATTTIGISKSRFFNDVADAGTGINNIGAPITANDNWWGADAFPGATGTDTVVTTSGGTTTVTTRLALKLDPTSASITTNSSTTLTASIVSTSDNTAPVTGTALEGLNLTFAPGALAGTSVNPTTAPVSNGTASTTFSSGSTTGMTSPSVTLDNGTKTTTITVTQASVKPTADPQSLNVAHDTAKSFTLTGSDPNAPPHALTFAIATQPTHGALSGFNASTGAVTYTPSAGYHGADSFTFTVSNGTTTSDPATVSLTVAVGTPTANAQSLNVAHDTATAIALTGTDNDTPALPLTFAIGTGPAHGMLTGFNASTGAVTYTPTAGYHGADSFTFTVSNGTNTSAAATVSLTVATGVPTANPQTVDVMYSTATPITLTGSDPDVPALPLTFAIGTGPAHGMLSGFDPATGAVTYTATPGYYGTDSFTFTVSNGTNTSIAVTVTLNVARLPHAPIKPKLP